MSIGKVSVSRPSLMPKEASQATSRLASKPELPSARTGQSSFQAGTASRPLVDLQGGAPLLSGGLEQAQELVAARAEKTGEVEQLTQELAVYGISLTGDWTAEEMEVLLGTVRDMDANLRGLMEEAGQTGFSEGELFQRLFGQVTFERVDAENLGEGKLAEQQSYDPATGTSTIRVSDGAFSVTGGNGRDLTPRQLIGHELAHIVNKRFLSSDGQYLGNTLLASPPSGTLTFSARTNNTGPEWAADVLANSLMGTLRPGTDSTYAAQVRDITLYLLSGDANMQ